MKSQMLPLLLVAALATPATAQTQDIRERLIAAGASESFADQVSATVRSARESGLPAEPIEAKAMEGWAKRNRVTPERVLAQLDELRGRLADGRAEAQATGLSAPPGAVVAAAAEALGRGVSAEQVREVIRSAPTPAAAAAGLRVAASLAAQGLETSAAVRVVRDAYSSRRQPEEMFELPSVVADLLARGVPMADIARRILEGGGLPLPPAAGGGGAAGRPAGVPPTMGPPAGTSSGRPPTRGRPD